MPSPGIGRTAGLAILSGHAGLIRYVRLAALLGGLGPVAGLAADPDDPAVAATIQMLADVTLIDQECRDVSVMFGPALSAGEARGVHVLDVMPAGALRSRFEAAYRRRFAETSHEDLCGAVVARYSTEIPGLFVAR